MADNDNLLPVLAVLEKWRSEGTVKDIDGYQIFVHTSGPESDHGVLIVHGYPGSSWDWGAWWTVLVTRRVSWSPICAGSG